jgi:4-hydroxy-tetrahydrodipicolinate reductase
LAALPIAIFGVSGRMGQSLIRAIREEAALRLSGAIASPAGVRVGQDAAEAGAPTGILVTADAAAGVRGAAVAMDFSRADALLAHARLCVQARLPLLIGVTGYDAAARRELQALSRESALLLAPNTSVGVGVLEQLAEVAARTLGVAYDVEISEAHHRTKRDAPSGTALKLGETVAAARGQRFADVAAYDRAASQQPPAPGSIGLAVVRAGDIVGEHTVTFAAAGERIEITHRATDRMIFARGALRAAQWLAGKPPGLYGMKDVLGL